MGKRQVGTGVSEFMAETTLGPDRSWVEWINVPAFTRAGQALLGMPHPVLLRLKLLKVSPAWALPQCSQDSQEHDPRRSQESGWLIGQEGEEFKENFLELST